MPHIIQAQYIKNMKRRLLPFLLALASVVGLAQDRLISIDSAYVAWRKSRPQTVFFDNEKTRLLMPEGADFGVECIPSFSPEWMLTYDSIAHTLTYREAEENIFSKTFKAWYKSKRKRGERHHYRWVQRKHPKDYEAPAVKSCSLAVTSDLAAMLRAIWAHAVSNAEEREVHTLDGTKWEYFINGKRAKSHSKQNPFVNFTNELKEAVRNGDANRIDSLIGEEFQRQQLQ